MSEASRRRSRASAAPSSSARAASATSTTCVSWASSRSSTAPGVADRIRKAADGRPITALIDNFGQDGRALAEDLGRARRRATAPARTAAIPSCACCEDDPESVGTGTALLQGVADLAEKGAFRLLVSGLYPLADVSDAYTDLKRLHSRGKVVLATQPVTTVRSLRARDVWEAAG